MKTKWFKLMLLTVVGLVAISSVTWAIKSMQKEVMPGAVMYEIQIKSHWTPNTFPYEYPKAGALTGPHFSGIIGASHEPGYTLFKEGMAPSPGLERLSEEGKHSPLDSEIQTAIKEGKALMLVESDPLRNFSKTAKTSVQVNEKYHLVSLAGMIAPSPDWFFGETDINLLENGKWVNKKTIDVYAWDSGGDNGMTYTAADMDNNPKQPTMRLNRDSHFVINGQNKPVATLTFIRK